MWVDGDKFIRLALSRSMLIMRKSFTRHVVHLYMRMHPKLEWVGTLGWELRFSSQNTPSKSYGRFASRLLHLDAFLSRSGSGHFRAQIHLPKAIEDLLQNDSIWTPFCPNLDQATFETKYNFPKLIKQLYSWCLRAPGTKTTSFIQPESSWRSNNSFYTA